MVTPCVGICRLRPEGDLCEGCLRTREEIAEWRDAGPERRRAILLAIDARRAEEAARPQETPGRRGWLRWR